MDFLFGYSTDIEMFSVCDGMGGLSNVELASAMVIKNLSHCFTEELPRLLIKEKFQLEIKRSISNLVRKINKAIVEENNVFIICSDGFYHKVSSDQIINSFSSSYIKNKYYIKSESINLVELIKKRQERDNISIITVKIT